MPSAELIIIGKELLLGERRDENVLTLSRFLCDRGFTIDRVTIIDDRIESISRALSSSRSDLVLTTGGLGSTRDDRTREAFSSALEVPISADESMKRRLLKKLERPFVARHRCFTMRLGNAVTLANSAGLAEGFLLKKGRRVYGALPGVPRELGAILSDSFENGLKKFFRLSSKKRFVVGVARMRESEIEDLMLDMPAFKRGAISILPSAELVYLILDDSKTLRVIRSRLGKAIFTTKGESLEEAVVARLKVKRKTVALAESCTGGGVAQLITRVDGASRVFLGGVVSYSNESKVKLLGVRAATIKGHGAVSNATAIEMAKGARKKFGSDIAIAITGIAGPSGGTPEKPVGRVHIAIVGKSSIVERLDLKGNRDLIRQKAARIALDLIRLHA